jgi:hypothetical protein
VRKKELDKPKLRKNNVKLLFRNSNVRQKFRKKNVRKKLRKLVSWKNSVKKKFRKPLIVIN